MELMFDRMTIEQGSTTPLVQFTVTIDPDELGFRARSLAIGLQDLCDNPRSRQDRQVIYSTALGRTASPDAAMRDMNTQLSALVTHANLTLLLHGIRIFGDLDDRGIHIIANALRTYGDYATDVMPGRLADDFVANFLVGSLT